MEKISIDKFGQAKLIYGKLKDTKLDLSYAEVANEIDGIQDVQVLKILFMMNYKK